MRYALISLVLLVGMLLPLQAGMNAEFRRHAGHALLAGVTNFMVGLGAIVLVALVMRVSPPALSDLRQIPWWAWLGGTLGASLVVTSVIAAPKLGAAMLVACLVCGQLTGALLIDQFGIAGYPQRPITPMRLVGVLLLIAGVIVIERSLAAPKPAAESNNAESFESAGGSPAENHAPPP
ncbi:MAG: DMT family transporter [Planctomycetota bacterium]